MLKISEFSRLAQIPVATLRYYDQIGLLRPAQVDRFTDYRYYDVSQLAHVNRISALKDLGFSLDQIARMLDDNISVQELRGMLRMRMHDAEHELHETQARLTRVSARLAEIEREGQPAPYDVVIKPAEALSLITTRQSATTAAEIGTFCDAIHAQLRRYLTSRRIMPAASPAPQMLNIYHMDEYRETDIDMELGLVIDPGKKPRTFDFSDAPFLLSASTLQAETLVASGFFRGSMAHMDGLVRTLLAWIGTNPYRAAGPLREMHHVIANDMNSHAVELQIPIRPIAT
jgi:DNA-binding transcriptional MerR regulator